MAPGSNAHTPPFILNVPVVGNVARSGMNTMFFGVPPPTVMVALAERMFDTVAVRMNFPDAARVKLHPVTAGGAQGWVVISGALHLNVTWIPCWLPRDPAGHFVPAGNVVRFWLVPFGPLTKIRNVCPAFADPKQNNASMKFALITANRCDGTVAPLAA